MKALYAVLLALVLGLGCGKKPESPMVVPNKLIANPTVEKAIRKSLKKPTGELTKADLEKVTALNFRFNQLTDVKGLENLTQLKELFLDDNPALTKAQIDELQKALPNCEIESNPTK